MDWLANNPGQALITLGITLLIIEVVIMGFSTFLLTFFGLSAIVSGIAVYFGLLSNDLLTIVISNTVLAALFATLLWKPLKNLQNTNVSDNTKSDLEGLEFTLTSDLSQTSSSNHRLSGVDWQVKSHTEIASGEQVIVEKAEVGTLWVTKK